MSDYEIIVEWYDCDTELSRMKVYPFSGSLAAARRRAARELVAVWTRKTEGGLIPEVARVDEKATENTVAIYDWDADFETPKERKS